MREVTKYLAEGVEAKEILIVRNQQLRVKDSLINTQKKVINLFIVKDSVVNKKIQMLEEDNEVCNKEYNKLGVKFEKTKKHNSILKITNIGTLLVLLILLI